MWTRTVRHVLTFECLSLPWEQRLPLLCEPSEILHTSDLPRDTVPRVQSHQKTTHQVNNVFLNGIVFIKKMFAPPHKMLSMFCIQSASSFSVVSTFPG